MPAWHGRVPAAFVDSMIAGGIDQVKPPYEVRVFGSQNAPADVQEEIIALRDFLRRVRERRRARLAVDPEVSLTVVGVADS